MGKTIKQYNFIYRQQGVSPNRMLSFSIYLLLNFSLLKKMSNTTSEEKKNIFDRCFIFFATDRHVTIEIT